MNQADIKSANKAKFDAVKALSLPLGHYAITSSGPMGARGLRAIGDADVVVDDELWRHLEDQYGVKEDQGVTKINLHSDLVEILGEGSFFKSGGREPGEPTVEDQIRGADIIDGLPFVKLEHVLYFKQRMGRAKDKKDIELIEEYMRKHG